MQAEIDALDVGFDAIDDQRQLLEQEIVAALGRGERVSRTVNAHLRSIYSKLAVTTRSAATRYALDHAVVNVLAGGSKGPS